VRVARVYDVDAGADAAKVLVDRLWPRGIRTDDPRIEVLGESGWSAGEGPTHRRDVGGSRAAARADEVDPEVTERPCVVGQVLR